MLSVGAQAAAQPKKQKAPRPSSLKGHQRPRLMSMVSQDARNIERDEGAFELRGIQRLHKVGDDQVKGASGSQIKDESAQTSKQCLSANSRKETPHSRLSPSA